MTSTWKILAPIDLSRTAHEDVEYAHCVAAALGADLHLLSVVDGQTHRALAPEWPSNAQTTGSSDVRCATLYGPVAATVADYADTIEADLILMTSRRYGRWSRFWRGSVTQEVMRLSHRPVFIASTSASDGHFGFRHKRVLCVAGLGNSRESALVELAGMLAARTAADLKLVHVVPPPSEAMLYHTIYRDSRPLSRERAARDFAELTRALPFPASTSVIVGEPDRSIGRAAREHSADLVLVSRTRGSLPASYGNNLDDIAGKLHCPMLTVPVDSRTPVLVPNDHRSLWSPKVGTTTASVR